MKLKLFVAIAVVAAIPAFAQAQQGGAPPKGPKPTKADAQKVVQMISADKTKQQEYCALGKLNDQMAEADQKKDNKALDALGKQADDMAQKLGPDYIKLMDGVDQLDETEGKAIADLFEPLDKQCAGK